MKRLHIFRAGRHVAMGGGALAFAESDLAAVARGYDPAKHEAPIVVGHPALDAPAYGWVGSLAAEGGELYATPREVEPAFAEMVQAGRFKKVSACFFAPDHGGNPTPGSYYLKHVGFLGATAPAVKGLKPIAFSADHAGTVTVEFAAADGWRLGWIFSDLATLLRGVRDHILGQTDAETADRVVPGATLQRIAEEAARLSEIADATPVPAFAEPAPAPAPDPAPPERSDGVDKTDQAVELQKQLDAANAQLAQFAEQATAQRRAANKAFVAELTREARLPAGLAPRVTALLDALAEDGTVAFAEGDRTVSESPRAAFQALLRALPPRVEFGEVAGGDGPDGAGTIAFAEVPGTTVNPDRLELHQRVVAYQRKHNEADYLTALRAVGGL